MARRERRRTGASAGGGDARRPRRGVPSRHHRRHALSRRPDEAGRHLTVGPPSGEGVYGAAALAKPARRHAPGGLRLEQWVTGGAIAALVVLIVLPLLSLFWGSIASPG